jgi:hypothetical protein
MDSDPVDHWASEEVARAKGIEFNGIGKFMTIDRSGSPDPDGRASHRRGNGKNTEMWSV